jgi:hypothetical protein
LSAQSDLRVSRLSALLQSNEEVHGFLQIFLTGLDSDQFWGNEPLSLISISE